MRLNGQPSRASLPFDLSHNRFPITYNLPEDAKDEDRKRERERLAKTLEGALKLVLNSEEYKSSLPKPPVPPTVKYREPLRGRARFRAPGKPIGVTNDLVSKMRGGKDWPVMLADGPSIWLRVMPKKTLDTPLKISELQKLASTLAQLPVFGSYPNGHSLRGSDGAGICMFLTDVPSPSVVFVFTDAEIWTIDTLRLRATPQLIALDESSFTESLQQCASFLDARLNIPGPYR